MIRTKFIVLILKSFKMIKEFKIESLDDLFFPKISDSICDLLKIKNENNISKLTTGDSTGIIKEGK